MTSDKNVTQRSERTKGTIATISSSYLIGRFKHMEKDSIFFKKFGLQVVPPSFKQLANTSDAHIFEQLTIVLSLVEKHIEYWQKLPHSGLRLDRLRAARRLVFGLTDAILYLFLPYYLFHVT